MRILKSALALGAALTLAACGAQASEDLADRDPHTLTALEIATLYPAGTDPHTINPNLAKQEASAAAIAAMNAAKANRANAVDFDAPVPTSMELGTRQTDPNRVRHSNDADSVGDYVALAKRDLGITRNLTYEEKLDYALGNR